MDARNRSRWLVGVVLIVCATASIWLVQSDDPVEIPTERSIAATHVEQVPPTPDQAQPQQISEKASAIAPSSATGTLRGRVIDAITREPVRDFKVEFFQAQGTIWRKDTPAGRNFRTTDGTFVWDRVPAGVWRVIVSAAGYQRFDAMQLHIEVGNIATEVEMPLRKGLTVRGRVIDELSRQGIGEATVTFQEVDVEMFGEFRTLPQTKTTADGSFTLDGVPPERIAIGVHAQGFTRREVTITVDEAAPNLEIVMSTGASIAGRLVTQDGTPASGSVGLMDLDRQSARAWKTDEQGAFRFALLDAGTYRLTAHVGGGLAERDVVLAHNQALDVMLVLQSGRTIRGAVVGLPLAELSMTRVAAHPMHEAANVLDAAVDAQGRFELRGAQAGRTLVVATTPHRRLQKQIDVPADADVNVELRAESGFRLHGRITKNRKPLADVMVTLLSLRSEAMIHGVQTSADGRYAIDGVPRGEWVVTAARYKSAPILIANDMEFDVDIPAGEFRGEVLDERTRVPIVGAIVGLWSQSSGPQRVRRMNRSDHFGRFALDGLDAGSYVLSVFRPGFSLYREQVEFPAQSSVTLHLSADKGVPIRARDAQSGAPLSALILIEKNEQKGAGLYLDLALDEEGGANIPSGFAGSTLAFNADRYEPIEIRGWNGEALTLAFRRGP